MPVGGREEGTAWPPQTYADRLLETFVASTDFFEGKPPTPVLGTLYRPAEGRLGCESVSGGHFRSWTTTVGD